MLVGKVTPEYFKHDLTFFEAGLLIKGQQKEQQQEWERSRFLAMAIYSALTGDAPEFPFPWDDEEDMSEEEVKKILGTDGSND